MPPQCEQAAARRVDEACSGSLMRRCSAGCPQRVVVVVLGLLVIVQGHLHLFQAIFREGRVCIDHRANELIDRSSTIPESPERAFHCFVSWFLAFTARHGSRLRLFR